jgi:hypothetical protein
MNVIHLCGGIGNQLFQYAFGRVQKENGIIVRYNPQWYKRTQVPPRPYRLDKFNIDIKISPYIRQPLIKESHYDYKYLTMDNTNFHGYWQYLSYYKNILPILKKELCVREEYYTAEFLDLRKQITESLSVSLHVRRQDYIDRDGFGCLLPKYYTAALEKIDGDVYIFSDDIEWCKENLTEDILLRKVTFVNLSDYLDLELMKACNHHILANSTFSWWAAILDEKIDGKVITPARWLMSAGRLSAKEMRLHYPEHWIKIG